MMKRFSMLLGVLFLSSCVDVEQVDSCLELRREYKELMFNGQYGTSVDRAVLQFWLEVHEKELEDCR